MQPSKSARATKIAVACVAAVMALTSCGNRLPEDEVALAQRGGAAAASSDGAIGGALDAPVAGGADTGAIAAPASSGAATATGNTGAVAPGATASGANPAAASGGGTTAAAGATTSGTATKSSGGSGSAAAVGGANAPCTQQLAPIVVGQNGGFSGLIGQTTIGMRTGMAVWAKWVNANGGIQCHPVQLYQKDDASDPAKAAANVQDLVQNKKAVAIVGLDTPIVVAAAADAARRLNVPVVGGDLSAPDWFEDSILFPSGGALVPVLAAAVTQAVQDSGKKKVAYLTCVEAVACNFIAKNAEQISAPSGSQVVLKQGISLTQPDFSAECQNAKKAGAEILFFGADGSALQRLASSCARVSYTPILAVPGLAASTNAVADPNIKKFNLYVGTPQVPFLATGTQALTEFHNAYKQFTGADAGDGASMFGWASGKLFEAALNAVAADARKGPVDSKTVFSGLYKLKNETLGGLSGPLNFPEGKPRPLVKCAAAFLVTTEGIKAPSNSKLSC
jgi:branched-chain amino acid transport system substrate-binding protein